MRIGIDLGGTKTEIIALSAGGDCLLRERLPTPAGYEAIISNTAAMVRDAETRLGRASTVGIGTPGAISPANGCLKNSNTTVLNGRPLLRDLETALQRPVHLANDADCFALSEARDGAGQGAATVFGVIVGTGCGGGVVVNGRLLFGPNAIAGEWGHNPLPWPREDEYPGPECFCGQRGCIETWVSGTGLGNDHLRVTGERMTGVEVAERAEQGNVAAEETLQRYEDRLARSLASVINMLDPDVIVLGGGVSQVGRLYDSVPKLWQQYVYSDRCDTPLRPPVHGAAGGARGAAWLW
jgi:fructokinase